MRGSRAVWQLQPSLAAVAETRVIYTTRAKALAAALDVAIRAGLVELDHEFMYNARFASATAAAAEADLVTRSWAGKTLEEKTQVAEETRWYVAAGTPFAMFPTLSIVAMPLA